MVVESSGFSGWEKMGEYIVKQLLEAHKEENHVTIGGHYGEACA